MVIVWPQKIFPIASFTLIQSELIIEEDFGFTVLVQITIQNFASQNQLRATCRRKLELNDPSDKNIGRFGSIIVSMAPLVKNIPLFGATKLTTSHCQQFSEG